jgi:hypothetical protein
MPQYTETFRIESSKVQITFRKKGQASKMRINRLIYKTASLSNYVMLVIMSGWIGQSQYNGQPYSRLQSLPRTTLTEVDYEANDSNNWDVIKDGTISTHILECLINADSSNTDISSGNPLYIELSYWMDE